MRRIREVVIQGKTYRETEETNGIGEFFGNMNQSIGYALTPIRFKGGFRISTSWLLFGLIFCMPEELSGFVCLVWLVSLFVRFE